MVRRQACANVFGLSVEISSPGYNELRVRRRPLAHALVFANGVKAATSSTSYLRPVLARHPLSMPVRQCPILHYVLLQWSPKYGPHVFALNGDHGIGKFRDNVLLLLRREYIFNNLHLN